METYIVTVPKLNKRSVIPHKLPDPNNIVGEVKKGFSFFAEEVTQVPNQSLGKWYRDRDGHFYWGGGVLQQSMAAARPAISGKMDWGFIDFKIEEIWAHTKGENVSVAILDSGLDFNLPDFSGKNNIQYFNAVTGSDKREDCMDTSGHGTDCAAMVCAQGHSLQGVAPKANLLVIKITDTNNDRPQEAILAGLDKAIQTKADIISLSFGISSLPSNKSDIEAIHEKIKLAYANNQAIVGAVGNSGNPTSPVVRKYPASFPECISVGGINKLRRRSSNSSKSMFLDLMGPGEELLSVRTTEPINGSSFSTPFVAGAIALLKSAARNKGRELSNIELYDVLKRGATNDFSEYSTVEYGWGILNAVESLNLLS